MVVARHRSNISNMLALSSNMLLALYSKFEPAALLFQLYAHAFALLLPGGERDGVAIRSRNRAEKKKNGRLEEGNG